MIAHVPLARDDLFDANGNLHEAWRVSVEVVGLRVDRVQALGSHRVMVSPRGLDAGASPLSRFHDSYFFNNNVPFVPPKPKEFDSA